VTGAVDALRAEADSLFLDDKGLTSLATAEIAAFRAERPDVEID